MQPKVLLLCLLTLPMCVMAQPQKGRFDHEGSITLNDGTVKTGIIRVFGNADQPWGYQSDIKFIPEATWATLEKTKNKDWEKYGPKELKSYHLNDLDRTFVSKPFSDMSSVSLKMVARRYFMHQIAAGKLNLYFYYDAPPNVYVGTEEDYEKIKQENAINNYVLLEKTEDKLKNITDVDLLDYIGDCPSVVEKYQAGGYGPKPGDDGKKKGLGKFVARVIDSNRMREYAEPLIRDYNACP